MIDVIFKDVGQGDSIIIQWSALKKQIGIIDCNLKMGVNPVIEHLKGLPDFEIEFIVLSHPHEDHYSGMLQLLEYIETNSIPLKYFFHSCHTTKEALLASVRSYNAKSTLYHLFKKIKEISKIASVIFLSGLPVPLPLTPDLSIEFPYPRSNEINKYNSGAYKNQSLEKNNPASNLLSTVCKLMLKDWYVLFTSDADRSVFADIHRRTITRYSKGLIVGQIAHHGSGYNFLGRFWKQIFEKNIQYAVISVGENDYGHPSPQVLSDLSQYGYQVVRTDTGSVVPTDRKSLLDMISTPKIKVIKSNDIIFKIDSNGTVSKL